MNDILVRAIKTFVQSFLAAMVSEFYLLMQTESFDLFGVDPFLTFAPVICAGLAAGFSAVGNFINGKFFPTVTTKFSVPADADDIVKLRYGDFKDSDFRLFIHRLSIALLDVFPEDVDDLPSETISLNNNSSERDVVSTLCAE